ncbi:hypothetical protein HMPREF0580_2274 [Mobiluncus mulieris ATCC 35239]|uniref:Uncharacterized protein n=1 Tax=Mobiluncus mulieris ATCC 35239 TaxID=871571 RepID=E0QTQ9_9ACTO|nr:hypothetical protein HMPREF0580_2274 [Mobiluncus mulieris ATCC 35239]
MQRPRFEIRAGFLSADVTAYFFGAVPQGEFAKPGFSSVS